MNDSVMIGELAWPEYARRIGEGQAVLIPIGALEQHGPHMSMNPDVLLPSAIGAAVAKKIGGLVAPPIAYGYKSQQKSGGGNHLCGTTSLN
ncbi:creatininase family protein, partial [Caballeronia grimmiae]|uniref:creatininase family protein n=1 Tax=Caballeronia grimmiae TaxID=1071679 RepID=UPI0038B8DD47